MDEDKKTKKPHLSSPSIPPIESILDENTVISIESYLQNIIMGTGAFFDMSLIVNESTQKTLSIRYRESEEDRFYSRAMIRIQDLVLIPQQHESLLETLKKLGIPEKPSWSF